MADHYIFYIIFCFLLNLVLASLNLTRRAKAQIRINFFEACLRLIKKPFNLKASSLRKFLKQTKGYQSLFFALERKIMFPRRINII